jgi:hypothetical protein
LVHALHHGGIIHDRRGVVGFDAGINHQWAAAAEVLFFGEGVDAVDVGGGVGAGKRDPQPVTEGFRSELAIVDEYDEREVVERADVAVEFAEAAELAVGSSW